MTTTPDPTGGANGDATGDATGEAGGATAARPAGVGLVDPVAAESLEQLAAGLEGLCGRQPWRLSDDDLAVVVQRAEVARRRLLMVQVAAAVEAGTRGLPRRAGFGPGHGVKGGDTAAVAAWVRSLVNVSRAHARRVAEVGAALFTDPVAADLAETRAAALSGQITARHVAVIASAVAQLSPPAAPTDPDSGAPAVDEDTRREAQRVLVEHAAVLDPVQTAVVAKRAVAVLDPGAADRLARDEDARAGLRGLSFTPDGSGLVHLRGTLTPQCAGLLATAIDAASAPRPAADGTPDPRPATQRRHDGLQHVLAQLVAADGLLPTTHGSPYRLVVTVPHTTLTTTLTGNRGQAPSTGRQQPSSAFGPSASDVKHSGLPGESAEPVPSPPLLPGLLPDGFPLSPLTVQTLACSADLVPVLVDDDHQPLDVGDTQYPFPAKIRTAIITRDRGCTYPGCGAPAPWCDCHHLTPYSQGGATSVDNGALLCGRHHRYVHALNLTGRVVTRDGTSRVHWDHHPTSWTATTATQTRDRRAAGTARHDPHQPPPLTDRCLDELIQRWQQRRRARARREAA